MHIEVPVFGPGEHRSDPSTSSSMRTDREPHEWVARESWLRIVSRLPVPGQSSAPSRIRATILRRSRDSVTPSG
jgi:hypothetical protein